MLLCFVLCIVLVSNIQGNAVLNYGCHTWYKVYSYSSNWDQCTVTIHPGLGHARFQGESLNLPLVFGHNHFNLCSEVYKLRSRSTCCIWLISRALS